ncbi:SAP domain-containing ribonucleoprotein isoform X4 [Rissa tridactyla]|uniref:SAP domain-containing ribonucleoprotein isoform X4 n=1 Tax=Rissa tridactyla TaxID=75485 RepID=UPI0023BA5B51|nr:SAP domain-containing ribonucleoprotein isoform X4 [Rissa tridactyla]
MAAEAVELHKLKLAELKQECLARGLEAKGNKQDLINRLQAYLEEHAEEEANEEDVLGEEIEEEEQKPVEPPVKAEEPPDYGKEGSENNIRNIADGERRRRETEEEEGAVWHRDKFSRGWSYRGHRGKEEEKSRTLRDRLMLVPSHAGPFAVCLSSACILSPPSSPHHFSLTAPLFL